MFFPDSFPFPRLRKYEEFLKDTMTLSRKYQRRVELSIRRAFVSLTDGGGEFPTYFPTFPLSYASISYLSGAGLVPLGGFLGRRGGGGGLLLLLHLHVLLVDDVLVFGSVCHGDACVLECCNPF